MAEFLTAKVLLKASNVRHGFFTRKDGVSKGIYASLNTGLGSADAWDNALENRRRAMMALGAGCLVTPLQRHTDVCLIVEEPWDVQAPPVGDAVATRRPDLLVGVNTADCTPVLFADANAGVVAAAHAGWKGAIGGILEATVAAMERLGARRNTIVAAIGPTISQRHYEVGPEFHARFLAEDIANARFFLPSERPDHLLFDLPAYVHMRLARMDLAAIEDIERCTYAEEANFYSYRRATHRGEPDYGRQLSAIMLTESA